MAITTNVPSNNFEDLQRDVQDATRFANATAPFTNRVGQSITPIPMRDSQLAAKVAEAASAVEALGWFPVDGSFTDGGTITARNQVLFNGADSSFYSWSGALPKVVPAASTPASTGGISANAWVDRNEAALRSALADPDSTVLVGGVEAGKILKNLTISEVASGAFTVGTRIAVTDRGGGVFKIVSGGTANGFDILASSGGNTAQLETGIIINPSHFGVSGGTNDYLAIQRIFDYISNYSIIDASGITVRMDGIATLLNKDGITIKGGDWHWNNQNTNMIKLSGTLNSPAFKDIRIRGNNDAFISLGAIGCGSGTVTKNWLIENCHFKEAPFGVYINADTSGLHENPHVTNCTFTDMPRFANDSSSGSGLGLVFANCGGVIKNGKSSFNTFTRCGRHSLYVSDGGNITSAFDTFIEHRNDGGTIVRELAAMAISRRANNVNVVCPLFIESRDLSLAVQGVETAGTPTYGKGVSILSPKFINGYAVDLKLGNDTPSANGIIDDVTVSDVYIKQSGTNQANRIQVFSGRRVKIDGVNVEADNSAGTLNLVAIVQVFGFATPSELNDVHIKDVKGSIAGSSSRGVAVQDAILTGTHKLLLENITAGTTPIYQGVSVSPSNPNYLKIRDNKPVVFSAFTGAFTNAASEINTVDKYAGKQIFSLSGGTIKPLFATGDTPTSTWVDGAGTVVHTPA